MTIAFIAYYFADSSLVGSHRARAIAVRLETRGNELCYFTRQGLGQRAARSFLLWCLSCAWRLIRSDADRVYISCGPFWHLPFIWFACRLTGKKYICDFRDPWSLHFRSREQGNLTSKVKRALLLRASEFIEKRIYRGCERFWVCTPGMLDRYTELFRDDRKMDLVLNGYDFDASDVAVKAEESDVIRLVCLGKFAAYGKDKARSVLARLKKQISGQVENTVEILFVGADDATRDLIQEAGLESVARFYDRMPYAEAIRLAARADMGLCLIRSEDFDLGTKAFDYIGLGLTIFDSFEPDSNARRFFAPFISQELSKRSSVPDMATRRLYSRENQLRPFLGKIDGKE